MRVAYVQDYKLPTAPPFSSHRWPTTESERAYVQGVIEAAVNVVLDQVEMTHARDVERLVEMCLAFYLLGGGAS
jgi:hypothetical protein